MFKIHKLSSSGKQRTQPATKETWGTLCINNNKMCYWYGNSRKHIYDFQHTKDLLISVCNVVWSSVRTKHIGVVFFESDVAIKTFTVVNKVDLSSLKCCHLCVWFYDFRKASCRTVNLPDPHFFGTFRRHKSSLWTNNASTIALVQDILIWAYKRKCIEPTSK